MSQVVQDIRVACPRVRVSSEKGLFINNIGENWPVDHKYDDMLNCDGEEEEKVLELDLNIPEKKINNRSMYAYGVHFFTH